MHRTNVRLYFSAGIYFCPVFLVYSNTVIDMSHESDSDSDIVVVPTSATIASLASSTSALSIASAPMYAFHGMTHWMYKAVYTVSTWFATPEYDASKVTDAIEKLQSTLLFLDTKVGSMTTRVDTYAASAKALYSNKQVSSAVHQLRLKKMYERELAKMEALKFNIESNILHMESVGVMMETVSTIKETSHQFQVVSKHVDIARLEGSIEEMFEQRDTSKDIESILNEMHDIHEFNDDDLLQELEDSLKEDEPQTAESTIITDTPTTVYYDAPPSTTNNQPRGPSSGTVEVDTLVFPAVPQTPPSIPDATTKHAVSLGVS